MMTPMSDFDVMNKLYDAKKQLYKMQDTDLKSGLSNYRALYWARNYHVNTRLQKMSFKDLYYLVEMYKAIENDHHMVVEKSVQCFPPETKVVTPGGYVPICKLQAGDLVLTHTGVYSPVTQTFCREVEEDLIEHRADLMPSIRSTYEHPFYGYVYDREKYHYSRFDSVFGCGAKWIPSGSLKNGDYVCRAKIPFSSGGIDGVFVESIISRPITHEDGDWFKEKWGQRYTLRKIPLDYGFGQLVGLYLSEGWVSTNRDGGSERLCFGFHHDESNLEEIVRREVSRLYRGKNPIHTYISESDTCRRVFVSSYTLAEVFHFSFGGGAEFKSLPESWVAHAPPEFLKGVLSGALLGDGSISSGSQANYRGVSKELVNQIRFISAMFGVYGVIREEHPKGKRVVYSFVYSNPEKREYTRLQDVSDTHMASRVKCTKKVPFKGKVYNLEVAGDNSYVAEDYVVHNCGLSELFIIQSHVEAGEKGMTVMYVLPKYELRNRFVNNRIYKLHKRVDWYSLLVKQAETKVHRTSLMHFGKGTLAYVGSNVSDEFIEIPVDSAYVDEKDRCNQSNLLMIPDRLTASPYKYLREIGNPTTESFGIDERYLESSQSQWHIKCPRCGKWFVPDFWNHVVREISTNVFVPRDETVDPDPQAMEEIGLIHDCGEKVDRLQWGRWVHAYPNRLWRGYRVSKVFSKFTTLRDMYRVWSKAIGNDLKTQLFFNSDLGLPFSSKGSKITRALLDSCRRSYEWPVRRVGNENARLMGVDVGTHLHVVLRERVRTESGLALRMIGAWTLPGFNQLAELLREWKPACCVIDSMPEIHKVMELKEEFGFVWSSRFQNDATSLVKQKDKRELRMDRTAILDYVRQAFELQNMILPMQAESIEDGEYYAHMQASTRILEADEENPEKSRFVWVEGSRPDHFLLAEAYVIQAGMLMPEHGVFDFFDQEAKALGSYGHVVGVKSPGMSDEQREEIAKLQNVTQESFLQKQFDKNVNLVPPAPRVDVQSIEDTIKFMHSSQGYVDIALLRGMVQESEDEIKKVLVDQGFKESVIRGQYVK